MSIFALGLMLLLGAPVVEVFWLAPQERDMQLEKSFGQAQGGPFSDVEPLPEGMIGVSHGGLPGQEDGRVVPLSGRDSSQLVLTNGKMGVAGSDKPAGGGVPPVGPGADAAGSAQGEPAKSERWRDVLNAASTGSRKAANSAALPRPSERFKAELSKIASLAAAGAKGASAAVEPKSPSLASPSSTKLLSGPRVANSLTRAQAPPDYRGPAGGRSMNSGGGGLSNRQLESLAFKSGSYFDRGEGAQSLLRGNQGISSTSEATGLPEGLAGMGDPSGTPGAGGSKDQKTVTLQQKEDLNKLKQKMEMEKAIALKWDKKRYEQFERKKMIEQIVAQTLAQTAQQAFLKVLDKLLNPNGQQQNVEGQAVQ